MEHTRTMAQQVVSWFVCNGRFKVHAVNAIGQYRGRIIEMEDMETGERVHDCAQRMLRLVDTLSAVSGAFGHSAEWVSEPLAAGRAYQAFASPVGLVTVTTRLSLDIVRYLNCRTHRVPRQWTALGEVADHIHGPQDVVFSQAVDLARCRGWILVEGKSTSRRARLTKAGSSLALRASTGSSANSR